MERWDAYNRHGQRTGRMLIRGEPIPDGLYHLVCEVLVRHRDGRFLCMKRALCKTDYPGFYEATAGGSALLGEDKYQCVRRELQEETGILCEDFQEVHVGIYPEDNTIFYSFVCVVDCDPDAVALQEGETIDFCWLDEDAFVALAKSGRIVDRQLRRFRSYFEKRRIPV